MSKRVSVVLLLTLIAGISCITMYQASLSHRMAAEASANNRLKETAITLNRMIDHDLRQRYTDVQSFAQNRAAYTPVNWHKPSEKNPLVASMNYYVSNGSGYTLSMLVATDGSVLATNNRSSTGEEIDTQSIYEQNFAEALWFTDARDGKFLEGQNGLTGTTIIGPYNDKTLAALIGDDGLTLAFSTRVTNDAGQLIGIWVNFVPFTVIENRIFAFHDMLRMNGLSRTAITLLDTKGVVLVDFDPLVEGGYKRNYAVIGKLNMLEAGVASVAAAITHKNDGVTPAGSSTNPVLIDGYSYSRGDGNYPGLGWTVLVRANSGELFALNNTERALRKTGLILVGSVFLLSLLLAPLLTRKSRMITSALVPSPDIQPVEKTEKKPEKKSSKRGAALAETLAPEMQSVVSDVVTAATEIRREMERLLPLAQETKRRSGLINGTVSHAAMATSQIESAMSELTAATEAMGTQLEHAKQPAIPLTTLSDAMQSLMSTTEHLHDVTPFLTSLANQMHLLAMNASIEAARAGESGEGLATMANELKTLAAEATATTESIAKQLADARGISTDTLDTMRSAITTLQTSGEKTSAVSSAVEKQRNATSALARTHANTSGLIREVTDVVGTVEQGAEETTAAIKQLQINAATLHRHIALLNEKVGTWIDLLRAA
jgi:hypothetical protein